MDSRVFTVSASPATGIPGVPCCTWLFMWGLGIQCKSPCFCGKCFAICECLALVLYQEKLLFRILPRRCGCHQVVWLCLLSKLNTNQSWLVPNWQSSQNDWKFLLEGITGHHRATEGFWLTSLRDFGWKLRAPENPVLHPHRGGTLGACWWVYSAQEGSLWGF